MCTRKEFLKELKDLHGYEVDAWQPLGKAKTVVPTGVAIFTMGKDEEGYFHHLSLEFGVHLADYLKDKGVTHWQFAKYYHIRQWILKL